MRFSALLDDNDTGSSPHPASAANAAAVVARRESAKNFVAAVKLTLPSAGRPSLPPVILSPIPAVPRPPQSRAAPIVASAPPRRLDPAADAARREKTAKRVSELLDAKLSDLQLHADAGKKQREAIEEAKRRAIETKQAAAAAAAAQKQREDEIIKKQAEEQQRHRSELEKAEKKRVEAAAELQRQGNRQLTLQLQERTQNEPQHDSNGTHQQTNESHVPKSVVCAEAAWKSMSEYLKLVANIKKEIKPSIMSNPAYSGMKARGARMKINQAVGQVTQSRAKMREIALTIDNVLSSAQADSKFYTYLLDVTAKSLCMQADTEVSVHPVKGPALGQVAVMLFDKHPPLLAILLGRLMKRCPYIVPMYCRRTEGETEDEFLKRQRYKQSDGEWETEERYCERMCGMIRFYAAIVQTNSKSHAQEIDFGWQWLARILNMNPRKITPQLIWSFLQPAARPVVSIYADNQVVATAPLPAIFTAPIRSDIINAVHTNMRKNARQPYAVNVEAGHQTSAVSWGTGRAVARIPRVSGTGTHRAGQGAFGNMCRGGRMFAPTKTWRKWHVKTNQNEKRYATASAVAATAIPSLVLARGHRVEKVNEIPLVLDNVEGLVKVKDAVALLKSVNAYADVEKVQASKSLRAGKGKYRNRRHRQRRGPLVIYNEDQGLVKAFRNIPGVELARVSALNLLQLAPGGHVGRFVIWTRAAFERLDSIWGTTTTVAEAKRGYKLPQPILSNADLPRLINSEEVQAVVRPAGDKNMKRPYTQRKNPLKNVGVMVRLNPYAQTLRRAEILGRNIHGKVQKKHVKNKKYIKALLSEDTA
ncbi:hypothetical protein HDU84_003639 [Entophlyctis sp. JEL0112]|nr:hypothetical protein HDU84_003639 [Entophlyctis sp. JEL0112]